MSTRATAMRMPTTITTATRIPTVIHGNQRGNVMSHRLMRTATLATVAGWAITLSAPTALGQTLDGWQGSASCTVTGHSPSHSDYTNQETHKWEIIPATYPFDVPHGLLKWYWASWTVTGSGRSGHFSWTTNGGDGWLVLQFWLPSTSFPGIGSTMNIAEVSGSANDSLGTTVRNEVDGTLSTAAVYELPFPTIAAAPGSTTVIQGSSSNTINGSIFFKRESSGEKSIVEPDDGVNTVICSWDFKSTLLYKRPGKLCLPGMPDCDKPFVLKPPIKRPD
jgi:hypothetical protein